MYHICMLEINNNGIFINAEVKVESINREKEIIMYVYNETQEKYDSRIKFFNELRHSEIVSFLIKKQDDGVIDLKKLAIDNGALTVDEIQEDDEHLTFKVIIKKSDFNPRNYFKR
ncbi:hypothetical protein BU588_09605 [Staphylococcus agnetis]|nr:hypothetical protein BU588_09605 [Staphylococcus agnetis]